MKQRKKCQALFIAVIALFIFTLPAIASEGKVNINTATEKELCTLKRVGPKYAKAIIEYRNREGAFNTPGDIIKVKGIGRKTFEVNKAIIVVKDGN
ncbi:MAG: helix-hairpin-helix domain-containing protein [Desulfobacteraceae bacterium]|nr:helix-hairpin-helix domain-containing protein [Desulfobacteraceae bacterium]